MSFVDLLPGRAGVQAVLGGLARTVGLAGKGWACSQKIRKLVRTQARAP